MISKEKEPLINYKYSFVIPAGLDLRPPLRGASLEIAKGCADYCNSENQSQPKLPEKLPIQLPKLKIGRILK
ncbi:MAG: hypothetical protein M1510_03665 [Nitrospirae bacterium]|nr:hypothetical protein [Nitrospirota bacterium]